jgi:pyruvate formate lyase activating enzyme
MRECINYQQLDGNSIQCQTCSHFCKISTGQVGICGIRKNESGKLYLLPYGKTTGVQIDPIEKKPLYHFLPDSQALSFGTFGCNFHCQNCLNWRFSQIFNNKGDVEDYSKMSWGKDWPPKKLVETAVENDCQSIAYTYNEPTIFLEYALETMKLAHQKGLKNVWVSNGFMTEKTLDEIIPYLDGINIDIKSFEYSFYKQVCGGRLQPVLNNCKRLAKSDAWLEVSTLVIPTLTDDPEMLRDLARFILNHLGSDVPWHIIGFSASISWQMHNFPDTPPSLINKAYQIGRDVGLDYVYAGKVGNGEMQHTYCPECGEVVIKRSGYYIEIPEKPSFCPACSHPISGVF